MNVLDMKEQVVDILVQICQEEEIRADHDLDIFENGLLDSFGVVSLLVEIESQLDITVPITEFDREEWNSVNAITEKLAELA